MKRTLIVLTVMAVIMTLSTSGCNEGNSLNHVSGQITAVIGTGYGYGHGYIPPMVTSYGYSHGYIPPMGGIITSYGYGHGYIPPMVTSYGYGHGYIPPRRGHRR